jgi:hypothetical protein
MRLTAYNSFTPRPRPRVSLSFCRLVQAAACTAVFCLTSGTFTPAHAQDTPSAMDKTQGKKGHKKSHAPKPPKMDPKKGATEAAARIIVVFPPETKGGVSDQIADTISEVVQSRLSLSGQYRTVYFLASAPTVRRALIESTVTKEEVDKPVAIDSRIKKLTLLSGHDMAVAVSIIDYQFDKATNKVSMVLSAKILDYTGAAPHGTNRNGESPAKLASKATEYDLAAALARDLTDKMMTDLLAPKKAMPAPETEKK